MNVLQLNYQLEIGGQEAHVRDLCNYQARHGHRVVLWTKSGVYEDELEGCEHRHIPFEQLVPWPERKLGSAVYRRAVQAFRRQLDRVLAERHIDLIHTHGVTETTLVRAALQDRSVPLLYSSHGWALEEWPWHMRYLSGCDHYIAVSRFTESKLREYGVLPDRISRIPYGIAYKPAPSRASVRVLREKLLRGSHRDRLVVSVARLHRQKGHDILLRAIASVRQRTDRAAFAFVGDGPERGRLEQLVGELGLGEAVSFVGMQRDVAPFLHAADVFCLPSRYEALPLAIPEAYRAGLPVIACDVAGCAEIVHDGETGFLLPSEDSDAVAQALLRVLSNDDLRGRMARCAKRYGLRRRFDSDHIHGRIMELYRTVVERPLPRPPTTAFESLLTRAMNAPDRAYSS